MTDVARVRTSAPRADVDGRAEIARATFVVPAAVGCRFADLVAEFAAWVPLAMDRRPDGSFGVSVGLEVGRRWSYCFLVDGNRYINDWDADDYIVDVDGRCVSVIST